MDKSELTNLPFTPTPKGRATLKSGALYAIDGSDSFILRVGNVEQTARFL